MGLSRKVELSYILKDVAQCTSIILGSRRLLCTVYVEKLFQKYVSFCNKPR
jgi:hypothetical protein